MKDQMDEAGGRKMKIDPSCYLNPIRIGPFDGGFISPLGDGGPDGGFF
jgi:hypothetical protein